jgi:glycosyltransferase involved in cell wall biosynthesis
VHPVFAKPEGQACIAFLNRNEPLTKKPYFALMNKPVLSVVIPVYNCAPFLRETMESLLHQTFGNFELVIVNDGSTDTTEDIIRSFTDSRIVYTKNEKNEGLVFTLNKGLQLSSGEYIARMDGDDICLPQRFQRQLDFFTAHPDADFVATQIELVDEKGDFIGYWEEEKAAISPQQIRRQLPKDNCIAHPTVMGKAVLFKQYKYDKAQSHAEDYDLWLRLQADKITMYKVDEVLVKHRIVTNSFTRQRQKNVFWKNASTKRIFLWGQLSKGRFNLFIGKTFFYMLVDLLKGFLKMIKKGMTRKAGPFSK